MRRFTMILFALLMAACLEETESCTDTETPSSPSALDYSDDSSDAWTTYQCDNLSAVWRGGSDASRQVTTTCQTACSYINVSGPDSAAAREYCNRLLPSYDDLCRFGANCDFRRSCIPCGDVPR